MGASNLRMGCVQELFPQRCRPGGEARVTGETGRNASREGDPGVVESRWRLLARPWYWSGGQEEGEATVKKQPYRIVGEESTASSRELADWLAKDGQLLIPLVELLEKGERAIDEVIDVMGRATVEAVLQMSAEQVAGPKAQGRRGPDREVYWHGVQGGRVALKERQLRVAKPRLRKKRRRADESGEVEVPAYTALQADQGLADRMLELVMNGVSTRRYASVLPEMEHSTHYPLRRPSRLRHHRP